MTGRSFVGLIRRVRDLLDWAERDWSREPEIRATLRRWAAYFARLLCGEPEPRSAEDARRALRARRSWPEEGHRRNGNGPH